LAHHSSCLAQFEWFPIGAEWFYSKQESSLNKDFFIVSVEGDTVIAGRQARIIKSPIYSNNDNLIFVSAQGQDSVFIFSEAHQSWEILYDFSAKVGDTIHTYLHPLDTSLMEVVIDSISFIEINGDTFDVQYFSTNVQVDWSNQNIRFLGNTMFLLPQYALVLPQGPLRCYFPSTEKVYSLVEFACDLVPTVENNNNFPNEIRSYPNPAKDYLYLSGLDNILGHINIKCYNLFGQLCLNEIITEEKTYLKNLSSGVYFCTLSDANSIFHSFKLIKH